MDLKVKEYISALRRADVKEIKKGMNETTVNMSSPYRAYDVFVGRRCWKDAERVVSFSNWDPNYRIVDGLLPEERAALNGKKKLALSVIKHPNYNPDFAHRKEGTGPFAEKLQQWLNESRAKTRG